MQVKKIPNYFEFKGVSRRTLNLNRARKLSVEKARKSDKTNKV